MTVKFDNGELFKLENRISNFADCAIVCHTVLLCILVVYDYNVHICRLHGVDVGNMVVGTLQVKRLNRSTATSQDWDQRQNTCMQQVHFIVRILE